MKTVSQAHFCCNVMKPVSSTVLHSLVTVTALCPCESFTASRPCFSQHMSHKGSQRNIHCPEQTTCFISCNICSYSSLNLQDPPFLSHLNILLTFILQGFAKMSPLSCISPQSSVLNYLLLLLCFHSTVLFPLLSPSVTVFRNYFSQLYTWLPL